MQGSSYQLDSMRLLANGLTVLGESCTIDVNNTHAEFPRGLKHRLEVGPAPGTNRIQCN